MKRRDFITLLGGAAMAWPLAARAQQSDRMRRIGVLNGQAANDPDAQANIAAFLQGLQQLGWTDGRNVRIDHRWAAGNPADIRKYAAELVALAPDVILANGINGRPVMRKRPFKGRFCNSISEFESYMPSHAVGLSASLLVSAGGVFRPARSLVKGEKPEAPREATCFRSRLRTDRPSIPPGGFCPV